MKTVLNYQSPWNISTTNIGKQIVLSVFRIIDLTEPDPQTGLKYKVLYSENNNKPFDSRDEASAFALEHGYTVLFGRNSVKFVMSRRARKQGLTTDSWGYNNAQKRFANRKAA